MHNERTGTTSRGGTGTEPARRFAVDALPLLPGFPILIFHHARELERDEMEPRNVSPLWACGCVCVCSRVSPVLVSAWARACARVSAARALNGLGEGGGLVPRWGPEGPRARGRKRHQDQEVIRAARKGRVRGEGGATFCTSTDHAMPAWKDGHDYSTSGVHPFRFSPLHSYNIYLGISVSTFSLLPMPPPRLTI